MSDRTVVSADLRMRSSAFSRVAYKARWTEGFVEANEETWGAEGWKRP